MTLHKVLNGYIATTQEKKFTKTSYHLYINNCSSMLFYIRNDGCVCIINC